MQRKENYIPEEKSREKKMDSAARFRRVAMRFRKSNPNENKKFFKKMFDVQKTKSVLIYEAL